MPWRPFSGPSPALPTRSPRSRRWAGKSAPPASPSGTGLPTRIRIIPGGSKFATWAFSGQLDWNLGFAKLTSITAWRDNTIDAGNDTDYTAVDLLYEPATNGNQTDFKQFSEELRLAGKTGPLDWLVGGILCERNPTPNQTLWAGNDLDLYMGGLASASVGTAELSADPRAHRQTARRDLRSGRGRLQRRLSSDLQELRVLFERDLHDHRRLGSDGRLSLHPRKEGLDVELRRHGWRRRVRLAAQLTRTARHRANPALLDEYQFLLGYGCSVIFNPFFNKLVR